MFSRVNDWTMSREEMHCLRSYFVCKFPESGYVSASWLLKRVAQQISANKKNCYRPDWAETFQKWKAKAMTIRHWQKRQRHGEEILTRFNSQNPYGIKRDLSQLHGCWRRLKLQSKKEHDLQRREARKTCGGKAPASSSEVSKLVADVLPAFVNPLEQTFDDDAGEQLDLRRDKDVREVITCEVEPSLLADLKAIGGKGAEKVTKMEDNQKYV